MDLFFVGLLIVMLILVGYAKVQQGVAKTTGTQFFTEDENNSVNS